MAKTLAQNEEISKKFQDEANTLYNTFKSDREQFEDAMEVGDAMYKCFNNRTIASSEMSKGANLDNDPRAQSASTLFFRQVNQLASQGVSVEFSRDMPCKYSPIINELVNFSHEEANERAEQMNIILKWVMKKDNYRKKSIEAWHSLYKRGNIFGYIYQKVAKGIREKNEPVYETTQDEQTGEVRTIVTDVKLTKKEYVIDNFPSVDFIDPTMVYLDPYIADIQKQQAIIYPTLTNKAAIMDGVKAGYFDEKQVEKITDKEKWDGSQTTDFKQKLLENRDLTWSPSTGDMYLQWDIFMRVPIENDKWDEENAVPSIYWCTVIGNSPSEGVVVRLEENPDPDGEYPFEVFHALPDDPDVIYHVTPAEVIRSNYSTECTLKNLAIDNMALVNDPPLLVRIGSTLVKDFSFEHGQRWPVDDVGTAVREFSIRDTTQPTTALLDYIQADSMRALNTDKNFMGESFGARTSASEAQAITRNSIQPQLVGIRYVLDQKLGWYARKVKSYMEKYGDPKMIAMLTDDQWRFPIYGESYFGDFDVEISVVDEYEDNVVAMSQFREILGLIGQSAILQSSDMHRVHFGELLKELFIRNGINPSKIIIPAKGGDSARIARDENDVMMNQGQQVEINETDDDVLHLAEHEGCRLQYNGVEQEFPQVQFLDLHIAMHRQRMNSQGSPMPSGSLPAGSGNQTEGQVSGNEIAGVLGAQVPQA